MSEGNLEKYLIDRAAAHRVYQRKVKLAGRRGFPDRMLAYGGRVVFVELKNPNGKGRLSKMQEREIAEMRDVGLDVRVMKSKEEVDDAIKTITATT